MPRARAIAAAAAILLLVLVPAAGNAQQQPDAQGPRVRLVRQTGWIEAGSDVNLVVRTTRVTDPSLLEVSVTVHQRVQSRAELSRTFRGEDLRGVAGQLPGGARPLSEMPVDVDGNMPITIQTAAAGQSSDNGARIRFSRPGIYPIRVELRARDDGDTVDAFVTHVLVGDNPGPRLDVSVVVPLTAPPVIDPGGERRGPPSGASELAEIAAALDALPSVPFTLAPTAETLTAVQLALPELAARLAGLLGTRPVVAGAYVPIDPASLGSVAATEVRAQRSAADGVIEPIVPQPPDTRTWLAPGPIGEAAAAQLVDAGIQRLVIPANAVTPPEADRPPPLRPVLVEMAGTERLPTVLTEPAVSDHIRPSIASDDQPLAGQHLVAELVGLATLPQDAGQRVPDERAPASTAVVLPRDFIPSTGWFETVAGGLTTSPDLRAVPLSAVVDAEPEPVVEPRPTTTRRGRPGTTTPPAPAWRLRPGDPAALEDDVRQARTNLAAWSSVFVTRTSLSEERLLAAESSDLPVAERERRLGILHSDLEGNLHQLRLPPGRSLSLTARAGEIPVAVANDADAPARVMVRIQSEKLEFPDGTQQELTLEPHRPATARFRVIVRAAGTFPLQVRLLTPDGRTTIDQTDSRVRSNAVPGIGIVVSVGAGVVLLAWWLRTMLFPKARHRR